MKDSGRYLSPESLMLGLMPNMSNFDVKFISGENPYTIRVDGEDVFVYIKNLSPAQLSNKNPDIWRVQLPVKEDFEQIKNSESLFILLGYDAENDVYTSWNPYWCKQRLNVGKSVSLYSRYSLQQRIHESGEIEKMSLNNESDVVCIPAKLLYQYIKTVRDYFPEESLYVAKGSRINKRVITDPQALYALFVSFDDCSKFEAYLRSVGMSERAIKDYVRNLRAFQVDGYFDKYKEIFLQCSSIADYDQAIKDFRNQPDILAIDTKNHGYLRAALRHYVRFMKVLLSCSDDDPSLYDQPVAEPEPSFKLDQYGKLVELDSDLIKELASYVIGEEYPDYDEMIAIAIKHYPSEVDEHMAYSDWINLFKKVDWKKNKQTYNRPRQAKSQILRVVFPDGRVIESNNVSTTYCEALKEIGFEAVNLLNITHAGVNIVSRELDSKYADYQRPVEDGWFVMTNSSTQTKCQDLLRIVEEYGVNMEVLIIPLGTTSSCINFVPRRRSIKRDKIKVVFPDGRTIQPTQVLEALIEVVKYAGPTRVQTLNLVCGKDNLITKEPTPKYAVACKPVGDGWFCNTYSSTLKKLEQIRSISGAFSLGIEAELV